jgi:CBS domain-containing protein
MFSIYGVAGQLFRGSMEQLRQVGGVGAIARSNAIQAVGRDGSDPAAEAAYAALAQQATPSDEAHRSALAAYTESQKGVIQPRHPLKLVDALMSRAVITLLDTATVQDAWQTLAQQGVGQAPVLNAAGTLVGLLSRADLLRPGRLPTPDSHALVWRALLAQSVLDIMWTPVPSVAPDTDIRRVARVLLDTGLPGLPVVDEQGLVIGFVSRSDILRAVVTDPPLDLWG